MVRLLSGLIIILICLSTACTNGLLNTSSGGTATNLGFNKALSFNGASDAILLADSGLSVGSQFTIDANIYLTSTPASFGNIFSRKNAGTVIWRFVVNSSRQLEVRWYTGGCTSNLSLIGSTMLNLGQKYHVATDADGANVRLYIDGSLEASAAGTPNSCVFTAAGIGYDHSAPAQYFPGYIDNLRVSTFARYSGTGFMPPTAPYTYAGEYLLFNFDYLTSSGSVTTSTAGTTFSFVGVPAYINSPFP